MMDQLQYGQNESTSHSNDANTIDFAIKQALRSVSTGTIVQIKKVTTTGLVAPVGKVDVLPLVDLRDGIGRTSKHQNVMSIPYVRWQAGSKAIIMDPKQNDLGLVVFADRDTSVVRKTKKQAPPGSKRRFNMADGIYVGCLLAEAPTSYLRFTDDGWLELSPDNGTTLVRIKPGEVWYTPDNGTTVVDAKPNDIKASIGDDYVEVTPGITKMKGGGAFVVCKTGKVFLADENASIPMLTAAGPSGRIFGVL